MNVKELLTHSKKEYIAKIGNTFLLYPLPDDKLSSISREEIQSCFERFPDEIVQCLKKVPNVTKYSEGMKAEMIGHFSMAKEATVEEKVSGVAPYFYDSISFQAIWPRKNQDVLPWYSGVVVETFHIIYNGAIFLAFGESAAIGHSAYSWEFGREAMKIIKSCFENSNLYEVTTIGPIMLHPAVYCVFLDPSVELTLPTTVLEDNDLYVFFPYESDTDCEVMMQDFFKSIAREANDFYGNELVRIGIIRTEEKFRNKFEALPSLHQRLLKMNLWNPTNITRRYSCTRQLRDGIREAYELYISLMDMQAYINEKRSRYLSDLSKHRFLAPLTDYFDDQLSDVGKTDFSPILQGLRFFEEETRMVTATSSNLQAALIGGLVGAVIYAIVSALLG